MPAGLTLDPAAIDRQLARRQAGYGRSPRQRIETDRAIVTSGVRHGVTLGSPIAVHIPNVDHGNWSAAMSVWPTEEVEGNWRDRSVTLPRPGHADLAGVARGGFDDVRNVLERASARETAARVAAGAIAQQLLGCLRIEVRAHVRAIGGAESDRAVPGRDDWEQLDDSDLCCLDAPAERRMVEEIDAARTDRDTLGGLVEIVAYGVPPGVGGYATGPERLGSRLAGAAMAVQAMKGVEIGDGFALAARRGSGAHDELAPALGGDRPADDARASSPDDAPTRDHISTPGSASTHDDAQGMGVTRHTNRAGGIEGGMSNGAPIVLRVAMKPLPTLMRPLRSVDLALGAPTAAHAERSDVCAVPAAAVVLESVIAFELAAVLREQFGMQRLGDVEDAFRAYCERVCYPAADPRSVV